MRIKYMGNADIRKLEVGTDFGGRLGVPLDREIEWNWDNNHVIDTDDFASVDEEFWSLLLDEPDFKDISGMKRVPVNEAQQMWRAMSDDAPASKDRAVSGSSSAPSGSEGGDDTDAALAAAGAAAEAASTSTARRSR